MCHTASQNPQYIEENGPRAIRVLRKTHNFQTNPYSTPRKTNRIIKKWCGFWKFRKISAKDWGSLQFELFWNGLIFCKGMNQSIEYFMVILIQMSPWLFLQIPFFSFLLSPQLNMNGPAPYRNKEIQRSMSKNCRNSPGFPCQGQAMRSMAPAALTQIKPTTQATQRVLENGAERSILCTRTCEVGSR